MEMEEELRDVDLSNFLDLDDKGRNDFMRCEGCDGLLVGHLEVKCCGKEEVRYGSEAVRNFENWLKRVNRFREALEARRKERDEIRLGQIAEAVKVAVDKRKVEQTCGNHYIASQAKVSSIMGRIGI